MCTSPDQHNMVPTILNDTNSLERPSPFLAEPLKAMSHEAKIGNLTYNHWENGRLWGIPMGKWVFLFYF